MSNQETTGVLLMDREKLKENFFLDDETLNGLMRKGLPHISLEKTQLFDGNEIYAWLRKYYFRGGEFAADTD